MQNCNRASLTISSEHGQQRATAGSERAGDALWWLFLETWRCWGWAGGRIVKCHWRQVTALTAEATKAKLHESLTVVVMVYRWLGDVHLPVIADFLSAQAGLSLGRSVALSLARSRRQALTEPCTCPELLDGRQHKQIPVKMTLTMMHVCRLD